MKPIEMHPVDEKDMHALFREESDRGAAVLAGSFAENLLGLYLECSMVDNSSELKQKIFGENGALSSFSQRIDFAQAFGYLPKEVCTDLHLIRKIRNHFAHHPKEASFSTSPVRDFSKNFKAAKHLGTRDADFCQTPIERLPYLIAITNFMIHYNHKVYGYINPASG